jgi:aspartyl-tRNA(Asn)/glutamyl-tRNA(Gln) amidotransferase subunit A
LALEQARKAEQELRAGKDKGPLHGIPIALKDLYATKNIRTTCHSAVLQNWVPDHDATTVTKLREVSAVLLGKLGMHEFAFGGPSVDAPFLRFVIRGTQHTSPEVRAAAQVQPLPLDCVWAL